MNRRILVEVDVNDGLPDATMKVLDRILKALRDLLKEDFIAGYDVDLMAPTVTILENCLVKVETHREAEK